MYNNILKTVYPIFLRSDLSPMFIFMEYFKITFYLLGSKLSINVERETKPIKYAIQILHILIFCPLNVTIFRKIHTSITHRRYGC